MPDKEMALNSLDDVLAAAQAATPEDTELLVRLRDWLTGMIDLELAPPEGIERLGPARDALSRVIDGEATEPNSVLTGAAEALEQAVRVIHEIEGGDAAPEEEAATPSAVAGSAAPAPAMEFSTEVQEGSAVQAAASAVKKTDPLPSSDAGGIPAPEEVIAEFSMVLPDDADGELLAEYIAESLDHIASSEAALLELEANPEDTESLNTVFRAFHTIKGTSGFLGLEMAQAMAHRAETILSRAREGEIRLTAGYADLSLASCDVLKEMVQGYDGLNPGDRLPIPDSYAPLLARLINPEASGASSEDSIGEPTQAVGVAATGAPTSPAGQEVLDAPSVSSVTDSATVAEAAFMTSPDLKEAPTAAEASGAVEAPTAAETSGPADGPAKSAARAGNRQANESTIRVSTGRLDNLINMVGELVIAHSMVSQDPEVVSGANPRLAKSVSHSSKIVRELQDLSMSLRMVPLKGTFQKMARLVRDLSRKSGKSVQFQTEGEDTEIDRNMVEILNDPLVHMIRNACDHGVETADARRSAGKPETGYVRLRAYQTAGNVVIELSDDGKGLDRDRIIAKAIERGLISTGEGMPDAEAFAMIFQPGFSTAEKVTDVSGRGVGMDVVKRSLDSLRGRVQVTSTLGEGSVFTLHLPLTMAITDAMLVRVGAERYLIPTVSIEESFRPDEEAFFTVEGRGEVVMLRNEIIPIVRLGNLFCVRGALTEMKNGLLIAVEAEGRRCTLMVDELLGQHQVVVKSLGEGLGEIQGISGGTILGDGRVGLILDVPGILKMSQAGTTNSSQRHAAAKRRLQEEQGSAAAA